MIKLIRANMIRLFSNILYTGGLVIAFCVTFYFAKRNPIQVMDGWDSVKSMVLVSAATILFFSAFTGIYIGAEYTHGAIRNKIIAGHSQLKIYISDYISLLIGVFVMLAAWFAGGMAAGCKPGSRLLVYALVALFYNSAYIGIMMAISFRMKNQVKSVLLGMTVFYILTNSLLVGNFILMTLAGTSYYKIMRLVYNANMFGQCFVHAGLSEENSNPGIGIQLLLSVIIMSVAFAMGTIRINKRNVK